MIQPITLSFGGDNGAAKAAQEAKAAESERVANAADKQQRVDAQKSRRQEAKDNRSARKTKAGAVSSTSGQRSLLSGSVDGLNKKLG